MILRVIQRRLSNLCIIFQHTHQRPPDNRLIARERGHRLGRRWKRNSYANMWLDEHHAAK